MSKFKLSIVLLSAVALWGCGSGGDETVTVPKAATEGGNVVNDPKLKEQLMGPSGAQQQGAPPAMPGG